MSAFEWLKSAGLLIESQDGHVLTNEIVAVTADYIPYALFERALEFARPAWLSDADSLIPDDGELPEDARGLATALGLGNKAAYSAIQSIHGKVDLASRAMIGYSGEKALVQILETRWPGSTLHVAQYSDAFGFDIRFRYQSVDWHLEVKSTVRRGRLKIYMSRNEYEVGSRDPHWRLIVLGLDENYHIAALATLPSRHLGTLAPVDTTASGRWQAASFELKAEDLIRGMDFLSEPWNCLQRASGKLGYGDFSESGFAWMPTM
ncbi:protein NO VEIN domain-containing protein [Paraburkholderia graminis]|uniref:protein NO VEIN domain-containing protein n=1 Tax=Paraburkholderia graminis TaxID=60548 RepID=UPI0038BB82D0